MEVVLHACLAVICTGWGSGFQTIIIGINILAFYSEYLGRMLRLRYARMLPFGIFGMFLYLFSYVYVYYNPPKYSIPPEYEFWMNIILGAIVFAITLFMLEFFVLIVYKSNDKLEHQMSHDKLTELPNRYYMSSYLNQIRERGQLGDYWIAIADIDNFKRINDSYGHNCGDYVLKTVANILAGDKKVLCCRWGGEEFIFISKIEGSGENARQYLDSLRRAVESYLFVYRDVCRHDQKCTDALLCREYNNTSFKVTVTIGMSLFEQGMDIDSWISSADAKLYKGKQSGKNQVVMN
ncbi:GGDEF domain-containing protein [Butyrivibrio sp. MC2013]|uniref:GGDEF domain-containing protein n=1 Tax=Butyrivibrio sp. MC2013 TaxID=1280686 RepID=UPI0018C94ACF|nr:GGDEF domain-containing protein [Butyrivibrio sp. MC2013]